MCTNTNKEVVARFNKEFIEQGNIKVLSDLVHPNFVNHTISEQYSNNVDGLIQFANILRNGFPDLVVNIHIQVAENDFVTTLKTIEGTHLGEIFGKVPTGKKVKMSVIDIVRLKNNKYIEHWAKNDILKVIESL